MKVLFYNSGRYMDNLKPEALAEMIAEYYDESFGNLKCIVDFGFPQRMSVRITEHNDIPYCTIIIYDEQYERLKQLCSRFVNFEEE